MNENSIRVRFAPSPTGPLHIGGLRTALFNYLFSKSQNGTFIVRIEDTDRSRMVPQSEEHIRECLEWCGLIPDESPWQKNPTTTYKQSERQKIYKKYVDVLLERGFAYYAFDTLEEIESMKMRLHGSASQYNSITRNTMKNSLVLPKEEVRRRLDNNDYYVIRLKIPNKEYIRIYDVIRGWIVVNSNTIDDKVLLKSDGMPTYHLANVVDDHLMKISHVIRGEEWIPSTPVHYLLYKYLEWEDSIPKWVHLPLILDPDGKGKLSKRKDYDFPVYPIAWKEALGYRELGYSPEALVNYLSLLGWNPGDNEEIFTLSELINCFNIKRVGKSGMKFSIEKSKWVNRSHLLKKSDDIFDRFIFRIA